MDIINVGDLVIDNGSLRLRKNTLDNRKYAITTDVYKILSTEEDNGGYIELIDINTNRTLCARKNCLSKVY